MNQTAVTSTRGTPAQLQQLCLQEAQTWILMRNLQIFLMQANEPERAGLGPRATSLQPPSGAGRNGPTDCRRLVSLTAPACSKRLLYIQDSATGRGPPGVAEKKTREYGQEEGGLAWGRGYSQAPDCRVRTKTRGLITRCRQLRGRFQFLSSLSGSTRGTVRSSRNSTGSCQVCEDGRVSPGRLLIP